jgi:CRP/FNR family transcriptional regulator, cyclic AMP receptor protein
MSVNPDIQKILKGSALFKNFTDTGLAIVASVAQPKQVPAGTPLFVENMIGDGLYVIALGKIRLSVRGPHGQDVMLAALGPNDSLGEAALLRAGPRLCSATAEVQSSVIEISRRDIAMLQRTKPQACLKLMMGVVDLIGERLRGADPEFKQFLAWRIGM